jgi:hypothetical protein
LKRDDLNPSRVVEPYNGMVADSSGRTVLDIIPHGVIFKLRPETQDGVTVYTDFLRIHLAFTEGLLSCAIFIALACIQGTQELL